MVLTGNQYTSQNCHIQLLITYNVQITRYSTFNSLSYNKLHCVTKCPIGCSTSTVRAGCRRQVFMRPVGVAQRTTVDDGTPTMLCRSFTEDGRSRVRCEAFGDLRCCCGVSIMQQQLVVNMW